MNRMDFIFAAVVAFMMVAGLLLMRADPAEGAGLLCDNGFTYLCK